jgi:pyruvate/oxaloacetate carboxyltransferase
MLVTLALIIGLIYTFYDDIKASINKVIEGLFGSKPPPSAKTIEKNSFAAKEIATYIESCLSNQESLPEKDQKDVVCYTLLAKSAPYFSANKNSVLDSVQPTIKDRIDIVTDFQRSYVVIEFKDVGNKILVR